MPKIVRDWFSCLLWHPARKWSGSILTTLEPAQGQWNLISLSVICKALFTSVDLATTNLTYKLQTCWTNLQLSDLSPTNWPMWWAPKSFHTSKERQLSTSDIQWSLTDNSHANRMALGKEHTSAKAADPITRYCETQCCRVLLSPT